MQSFTELPISPYTQERLSSLNFSIPTPVQAAAIPQALAGKDVLATAQTGTGKTLAFLIPVIERLLSQPAKPDSGKSGIAALSWSRLVNWPCRWLTSTTLCAAQTVARGSGRRRIGEGSQLNALRRGARIVVATPGRLEDFLDRRLVNFQTLQVLILDEADRMLDMGFFPPCAGSPRFYPKIARPCAFPPRWKRR